MAEPDACAARTAGADADECGRRRTEEDDAARRRPQEDDRPQDGDGPEEDRPEEDRSAQGDGPQEGRAQASRQEADGPQDRAKEDEPQAPLSNCGDDVAQLWSASLFISLGVAFVPFLYGLRAGQGALGCGGSLALGLVVPLIVALEPFYIGLVRPLLDCGSLTRVPVILGTAPAVVLVAALGLLLLMRRA